MLLRHPSTSQTAPHHGVSPEILHLGAGHQCGLVELGLQDLVPKDVLGTGCTGKPSTLYDKAEVLGVHNSPDMEWEGKSELITSIVFLGPLAEAIDRVE